MSHRILCAVDNSIYSQESLTIMGKWFAQSPEVIFRLIHVSPLLKQLYPGEIQTIYPDTDLWKKIQVSKCESALYTSAEILKKEGIPKNRIEEACIIGAENIAEEILKDARKNNITTIAMGRRGLSEVRRFVLGGVSSRVVQDASDETVCIFDPPLNSKRALIALDGTPSSENLLDYFKDTLAQVPDIEVTLFHILPPQPASFWDDGHILDPEAREARNKEVKKWYSEREERIEEIFQKGKEKLVGAKLSSDQITVKKMIMKQGPARDILDMQHKGRYGIVVIGRQSMSKGKPYAIGGRAFKVLNAARNCMLCLVP